MSYEILVKLVNDNRRGLLYRRYYLSGKLGRSFFRHILYVDRLESLSKGGRRKMNIGVILTGLLGGAITAYVLWGIKTGKIK